MSELIDALNQLQKEKHIEKEVIMQAIEDSLVAACNRDFGKNAIVKVNMDRDTGDISVYVEKTVVEEVEDPATEISLADFALLNFSETSLLCSSILLLCASTASDNLFILSIAD